VEFTLPGASLSAMLEVFAKMDGVTFVEGDKHHLDLIFKQGDDSQSADLRPALPLTINW